MLEIAVPGRKTLKLENLVLDMNGTVAVDGYTIKGVAERINFLKKYLDVYLITAGTHGNLDALRDTLEAEVHRIEPCGEAQQKQRFIENLGADKTAAIGNGSNDTLMLKASAISIAVIGDEGASTEALLSAQLVVTNINSALDLLLKPKRLVATLRR